MNAFDRFNTSAAEDNQSAVSLNWQEATILNGVDQVIATLESLRTFNSDSDLDAYMVDAIASLRGIRDSLEG